MHRSLKLLITLLLLATGAYAVTLTGNVKNATTGKPSAGDSVELIALQQGMNALGSTKTDAGGSFKFELDDPNTPHLVRVTHQGVSYFPAGGPIRPGMTTVSIDVYDAGSKVDGVSTTVDVVRLQASGDTIQAMQLIAVKNDSNPPRSLIRDKTYEFYLPENAQLDQVLVQGPGGMPVNTAATPEGKSGKYYFTYAIKPGDTRFEVAYHLPYSGQISFTPKMADNVQHFVVMTPKSMKFEAGDGAKFQPMDDKNANVQVATNVGAATNLNFKVSGTGQLQEDQGGGGGAQPSANSGGGDQGGGGMSATAADNRPGGGLGPPTDAPDPLHSYRWVLLGGLGIILVCGAVFVVNRNNQQLAEAGTSKPPALPVPESSGRKKAALSPSVTAPAAAAPVAQPPVQPAPDKSSMLLEGLKEELFQLEVDKEQGRISAEDYENTKAALNQTLRRALQRKPS